MASQEAREAYLSMNMLPEFDAADVRAGRWDKATGLQAFARFEAETLERAAKVADAEWANREVENQAGSLLGLGGAAASSRIAAAIRNLKDRS